MLGFLRFFVVASESKMLAFVSILEAILRALFCKTLQNSSPGNLCKPLNACLNNRF